ncbi:PLP-dependent transferase [Trichodelitschia bisporula]|uniref:PLP-dependent transferase n=1 Tax=Trichodelitschia bisporula TaxID=703511 RepID=A0A6G1HVF0_9PEZI|nr:PLP-dependent transferase [Trichodelitschia bisporula]
MDTTSTPPALVLPTTPSLNHARTTLHHTLPSTPLGLDATLKHLESDIAPAVPASSVSPRYFGFITGGATPAARAADSLVTAWDYSVAVHLPAESIATEVEAAALDLLCDLLDFDPEVFTHRTFTTGATASNVIGLTLGRDWVVEEAARRKGVEVSVTDHGLVKAMRLAGLDEIRVLSAMPHSSVAKAVSIAGLGRANIVDVARDGAPWRVDIKKLRAELGREGVGSIVCLGAGEVNTGYLDTAPEDVYAVRAACDEFGAWLHADGAFGLMARILHPSTYPAIHRSYAEELADSITGDAHKLLNVPYDCGFFFSKHLALASRMLANAAAYLTPPASSGPTVPSPLNIGIENSRRFRALPVYATLLAYGGSGYSEMVFRQIGLARRVAAWIEGSKGYELLPRGGERGDIFMIVLFRARDEELDKSLARRINATGRIYVSGTVWEGETAVRLAVANWQVEVEREGAVVEEVLSQVLDKYEEEKASES